MLCFVLYTGKLSILNILSNRKKIFPEKMQTTLVAVLFDLIMLSISTVTTVYKISITIKTKCCCTLLKQLTVKYLN